MLNCTQYKDSNRVKWNDGKTEKRWKLFSPYNKLVQEPNGNEKNRSPDPDTNDRKINYDKEPNEVHKNTLTEEILQSMRTL
jgi:hypothetical protein